MTSPTLWRKHRGSWCDNCETAYPFMPASGNCPSCGPVKVRAATITVEPDDTNTPAFCNWCPDPQHPSPAHHPGGQPEHKPEEAR